MNANNFENGYETARQYAQRGASFALILAYVQPRGGWQWRNGVVAFVTQQLGVRA